MRVGYRRLTPGSAPGDARTGTIHAGKDVVVHWSVRDAGGRATPSPPHEYALGLMMPHTPTRARRPAPTLRLISDRSLLEMAGELSSICAYRRRTVQEHTRGHMTS